MNLLKKFKKPTKTPTSVVYSNSNLCPTFITIFFISSIAFIRRGIQARVGADSFCQTDVKLKKISIHSINGPLHFLPIRFLQVEQYFRV